jgi:hypothetical protein
VVSTSRPSRKSLTRRADRSISIRVRTVLTATSCARTHPVRPFGLAGSCTRYQRGRQLRSVWTPRTPKTVRASFAFLVWKRITTVLPGPRKALSVRTAVAAYALRGVRSATVRVGSQPPDAVASVEPTTGRTSNATAKTRRIVMTL